MDDIYLQSIFDPSKHSRLFSEESQTHMDIHMKDEDPFSNTPVYDLENHEAFNDFELEISTICAPVPMEQLNILKEATMSCPEENKFLLKDHSDACYSLFGGKKRRKTQETHREIQEVPLTYEKLDESKCTTELKTTSVIEDCISPKSLMLDKSDIEGSIEIKQKRNRESAKRCRQRKKEYIMNLERELREVKKELENCKNELDLLRAGLEVNKENKTCKLKEEIMEKAQVIIDSGNGMPELDQLLQNLIVL